MLLSFWFSHRCSVLLLTCRFWFRRAWGGPWNLAFPTSFQVVLMLLVSGPHWEYSKVSEEVIFFLIFSLIFLSVGDILALSPLVMPHPTHSLSRCSMSVSLSGWVNKEIHPGAYHDRLKCWLDTDAGGGMIPFDSCTSQMKRLFSKQAFLWWPMWWSVECLWEQWGPWVREGLLVPLGCIPHSCFPVSWTRRGIAEELWQFLITNKLQWISQQCSEAPGYRGPSCSHSLAEVTSRDSDPKGQWKMHLRCNISSGSCLLWWLSLTVQEGNERITLAKNEAHSKREEHSYRSSNYVFSKVN